MAHKSRKKHIKHVQKQQLEANPSLSRSHPPGTKATAAALGVSGSRKVRLTSRAKAAAKAAMKDRAGKVVERARARTSGTDARETEKREKTGLVRRIATAATKKITAKPQRALSRAKARVRSLLGKVAA